MKKILIMALILISSKIQAIQEIPVNWEPRLSRDWEIIPAISELRSNIPGQIQEKILQLLKEKKTLIKGRAFTYVQNVKEETIGPYKKMAVQYSTRLIPVAYDDFIKFIPPHEWGANLYGLIGRGVTHQEFNDQNVIYKQVERMVLAGFGQNMDMTKVEVIEYDSDKVTVFWRVRASDNQTTDSDIGLLEIAKHSANATLVTFHSAHRLRLFGAALPSTFIHRSIGKAFLQHLARYNAITENEK